MRALSLALRDVRLPRPLHWRGSAPVSALLLTSRATRPVSWLHCAGRLPASWALSDTVRRVSDVSVLHSGGMGPVALVLVTVSDTRAVRALHSAGREPESVAALLSDSEVRPVRASSAVGSEPLVGAPEGMPARSMAVTTPPTQVTPSQALVQGSVPTDQEDSSGGLPSWDLASSRADR